MKVLVTGVAGFIGMHCAQRLLERGDEVVGVDNLSPYYSVQLKKDRLAQLKHPAVGGVVRLPGLEAGDGGTGDRLGGGEVRLADGEADDVLHLGQHVEEATDA